MEGVFLLLVFAFYALLRLLFWLLPNERRRDRVRLKPVFSLLKERRFEEALPPLNTYLVQHPTSVEAMVARAQCHTNMGEPILALADCTQATHRENHLPLAYLLKGRALFELDELELALAEFNKAAWYDRESPEPITWRGLVYRRLGQDAKAEADFVLAATMGDENAEFYLRKPQHMGIWN